MLVSAIISGVITAQIYYHRFKKKLPATDAVNRAIATIMLQAVQSPLDNLKIRQIESKHDTKK